MTSSEKGSSYSSMVNAADVLLASSSTSSKAATAKARSSSAEAASSSFLGASARDLLCLSALALIGRQDVVRVDVVFSAHWSNMFFHMGRDAFYTASTLSSNLRAKEALSHASYSPSCVDAPCASLKAATRSKADLNSARPLRPGRVTIGSHRRRHYHSHGARAAAVADAVVGLSL